MTNKKEEQLFLFNQGTYYHAYNFMGCHPENGGAWFRVWAPNAVAISVVGDTIQTFSLYEYSTTSIKFVYSSA